VFVFLSKFLPLFVYPAGLAFLLLCAGLVLRRRPVWLRRFSAAALLIIFIGGNRWVAGSLVQSLEWRHIPDGELPQADAIVVLGGGTEEADYPRPLVELNSAGDRVVYGAMLYRQGKASRILVGGGTISWIENRSTTPAEEMAEVVQWLGVPTEAVLIQNRSLNTYEEAVLDAEILRKLGCRTVLLVTSAMHMPRSAALFEKQGLVVIPAPIDFKITESNQPFKNMTWESAVLGIIPDASNLSLTSAAMKEYIGLLVYKLRGWL